MQVRMVSTPRLLLFLDNGTTSTGSSGSVYFGKVTEAKQRHPCAAGRDGFHCYVATMDGNQGMWRAGWRCVSGGEHS